MPDDEPRAQDSEDAPAKTWRYPASVHRVENSQEGQSEEVELCCVAKEDAERFSALLDRAMIPHSTQGATPKQSDQPALHKILVLEEDLEIARQAINGPASTEEDDEEEDSAQTQRECEERMVRDWICPNCNRRYLVQMPLSTRQWHARTIGVAGAILLPLLGAVLIDALEDRNGPIHNSTFFWPALVLCSIAMLMWPFMSSRGKRCTHCEWQSQIR